MSNIKVSVVIPVFNRLEYTQKCLESILKFGSKFEFEIIVVDNASTDGTKAFLGGALENVLTIRNEENLGFAKACNQGAVRSSGQYLLFLNNDTIVTENWMDVLVAELDSNPGIAIAGSKLLFPDDTIQHAGVAFGEDKAPYHIYYRDSSEKPYVNKKREFQCVTGACFLIRKLMFEKIGGFDENFNNGYEDVDLCLKITELGFKIIYCPDSVVYHYESISDGRLKNHDENQKLFLKKWEDKITPDDQAIKFEDGTLDKFKELEFYYKNQIAELIKQNKSLSEELFIMKSSKFWKLRQFYMNIKKF